MSLTFHEAVSMAFFHALFITSAPLLFGVAFQGKFDGAMEILPWTLTYCIWFALFNLLPIPPLTGGHLLAAIKIKVPNRVHWILAIGLMAAAATGIVRRLLAPGYAVLAPAISGGTLPT